MQDIGLWLLRRYRRFRIQGDSMKPGLKASQEVLINPRAYRKTYPRSGDVVVAYHPHYSGLRIIKRVLFVDEDGSCYLKGDNAIASDDSRRFGLVPLNRVVGQAVCLFP